MKKEKVIMSFIATLIGLLVAGIAFFIYESSNTSTTPSTKNVSIASPSPTPKPTIFLTVDSPKDEEVVSDRIITISGQTHPNAIVAIISKNYQDVITPSQSGDFSTTMNIQNGQNVIELTAISENGESERQAKVVTFSEEQF